MNEDYYVMWLSRISGINNKKLDRLIQYFGTAADVYAADSKEIYLACDGETASSICSDRRNGKLEKYINELGKTGAKYISKYNKLFPDGLKNIDECPLGVYYKGTLPEKDEVLVSMVGSRRCTDYGKAVSLKLSEDLAKCGICIVSGLADGVDSYSAIGALRQKGKTIAVLGTSIEKCYPSSNKSLYDEIIKRGGCIISEYAPYEKTHKSDFVHRNRIIAALSRILIVVEAEDKSGTFSTVEASLSYGKTVFAVPGNIFSSFSNGTNRLIKEGCPPITGFEDVLFELNIDWTDNNNEENKKEQLLKNISDDGILILKYINGDPIDTETLVIKTGLPVYKLQAELTMLEVKGIIQRISGQRYILIL